MSAWVLAEQKGTVITLTLNRPQRHNSLIPELLQALLDKLVTVEEAAGVRAVVLQANGRSFSTGGDLRGFYEHRETLAAYAATIVSLLNRAILALVDLPVPVVAAVHGQVTGGSLGLVLASDVVLVAPEASFTPYYGVVGFSPDGGWTALLPGIIGPKRTAEVLMRNHSITAEESVAWGLASRIVPATHVRQEVLAVAQDLVEKMPGSLRHTKRLLARNSGDLAGRLEEERARFVQHITTEEARAGIRAYIERGL